MLHSHLSFKLTRIYFGYQWSSPMKLKTNQARSANLSPTSATLLYSYTIHLISSQLSSECLYYSSCVILVWNMLKEYGACFLQQYIFLPLCPGCSIFNKNMYFEIIAELLQYSLDLEKQRNNLTVLSLYISFQKNRSMEKQWIILTLAFFVHSPPSCLSAIPGRTVLPHQCEWQHSEPVPVTAQEAWHCLIFSLH